MTSRSVTAALVCGALLAGCATPALFEPLPCQRLKESPEVRRDWLALVESGQYPALRGWVRRADAICKGNRKLTPR